MATGAIYTSWARTSASLSTKDSHISSRAFLRSRAAPFPYFNVSTSALPGCRATYILMFPNMVPLGFSTTVTTQPPSHEPGSVLHEAVMLTVCEALYLLASSFCLILRLRIWVNVDKRSSATAELGQAVPCLFCVVTCSYHSCEARSETWAVAVSTNGVTASSCTSPIT